MSHEMKISDAKHIFCEFRKDFRPDAEALVDLFRSANISSALGNSNYLHALMLTELMFKKTKKSFCMVTGSAADGFIRCLAESFEAMLRAIRVAGGEAKMILLKEGGEDSAALAEFARNYSDVLKLVTAEPVGGAVISHFIVCDNSMVRDEKPHPPLTDESRANEVKADVYFSNPVRASAFRHAFEAMWGVLQGHSKQR